MERVSRVLASAQYNGTNGAEMLQLVQQITQYSGNTWSVQADDGATLVLRETGTTGLTADWPCPLAQYVVVDLSLGIIATLAADLYAARYQAIAGIVSTALRQTGSIGIAQVPSLILGASVQVVVPIRPIQPDASYAVSVSLAGSDQLLGSLELIGQPIKAPGSVTVTVHNKGILTLSGALLLVNTTAPVA